ncbi:MAG: DEAD/DEAH box helicase [Vicinamibacterales bacterium]
MCYQLPALHLPGMTLVVSPSISLMKDQTDKLDAMGVPAAQLNSTLTRGEEADAFTNIDAERPEFIITTPERVTDPTFLETLRKVIDLVVVDEAHCSCSSARIVGHTSFS